MTLGNDNPPDPPTGHTGPTTRYECPKCGDEFGNLPLHLRGCDE